MKKLLTIIMILCMVLGTGAFAYADVIPDYTGIDETENLIGAEETAEQGGSLSEEARMADTEDTWPKIYVAYNNAQDYVGTGTEDAPYATLTEAFTKAKTISETTTEDGIVIYVKERGIGSGSTGGDLWTEQVELTNAIKKPITLTTAPGSTEPAEPAMVCRNTNETSELFIIGEGAELILENITIYGRNGSGFVGSLFRVNKGTLTMKEGATLWGNSAQYNGGGVYVNDGGIFNMSGGAIKGNYANNKGGGVFVSQNSTFNMSGGIIGGATEGDGNKTDTSLGGGVYIEGKGTFNMSGGTIGGYNQSRAGGGVYMERGSEFTMTDGTISGNKATYTGGSGVYISGDATFSMSGGTITGNYDETTKDTGPVMKIGKFNLSGTPKITGNTAYWQRAQGNVDCDVYTEDGDKYFALVGPLGDEASIGVFHWSAAVYGTDPVPIVEEGMVNETDRYTIRDSDISKFFSNVKGYMPYRFDDDSDPKYSMIKLSKQAPATLIDMPVLAATSFEYDGKEKIGVESAAEDAGYTFTTESELRGTNVGRYKVTAVLKDKENTKWKVGTSGTTADVELTWEITPRTLTVTPDSGKSAAYNQDIPELSYTYNGNVDRENPAIDGKLYAAEKGSAPGSYPISIGTLALVDKDTFLAKNYELEITDGVMFTITKADQEAPKVTGEAPAAEGGMGKITGTTPKMEYQEEGAGDVWQPCSETETAVTADKSYNVRYKGDDNYNPSPASKVTVPAFTGSATKEQQTVTFEKGGTVTKTEGDLPFTNSATASGGGKITYKSLNPDIATVDENTGEVTILKAGTATIEATAAETDTHAEGKATYTLTVNSKQTPGTGGGSGSGGGGGGAAPTVQKPTIEAGEGAKVTLSPDGTTATITATEGYEIADVTLNGESKGTVPTVSGLKTGDKVVITTKKKTPGTGSGSGGGGGGGAAPTVQKPTIEAGEGAKVTLSPDGTTATITATEGYEIADVTLNGESKGTVPTVSGLKTGDKVVITTKKKSDSDVPTTDEERLAALKKIKWVARSSQSISPSGKKCLKIRYYDKYGSKLVFDGVEIWRSTKRYSGYGNKPFFVTTNNVYYNTKIKRQYYYYKVRGFIITSDGEKHYSDWSLKAFRWAPR